MLIGLLIAILTLVAVLAIPLTLRFEFCWPDSHHSEYQLRWAFGLVRKKVRGPETARCDTEDETHASRYRAPPHRFIKNAVSLAQQTAFRQKIIRLFARCWHAIGKDDTQIGGRIGLGDPADTGMLWSALGPISGALNGFHGVTIDIEPDFDTATIMLDGSGSIRVIPLQLIGLSLAFILSPSVWRTIGSLQFAAR